MQQIVTLLQYCKSNLILKLVVSLKPGARRQQARIYLMF